jgi:hypothetical protein
MYSGQLGTVEDPPGRQVTGDTPTVLAFALGRGPGLVAFEVLNQLEPATVVYRGELAAVNRALGGAGFRAAALAPAASVPHDAAWADRIAGLFG